MAEYIDRGALAEKLITRATRYAALGKRETAQDYLWVVTVLDSEPAADVGITVQGLQIRRL